MTRRPRAVLFDFDGTLIDSAPDLAGAGNDMRVARGLPPLPFERFRPLVGAGARGMVGAAFGVLPGQPEFDALRTEFLDRYEQRMLNETVVFAAMEPILEVLDNAGLRWGIVTNKMARYTLPMVEGLGLERRAAVVVCGDTTPHAKPHPAPLLEAAARLALAPADCVYVGDDLRDVQAGKAAGMPTLAAAWGYLGDSAPIELWGAGAIIDEPAALLKYLALD
jgi:phosphoglycolate phosphatase